MTSTGFDPGFDDTTWTDDWYSVPIVQMPPGEHPGGYQVAHRVLREVEVFGRPYRLVEPLNCSFLYDPDGRLWMSNTPQERIMMYNNGRYSWGHVLVGGLGLGLYPQYAVAGAAGDATRFSVIEQSVVVRDVVAPTLTGVLPVPLEAMVGDVATYLAGPANTLFNTIFIDTWETLDAVRLPEINRLRDLALRHLAPDGRVLLWGYRWMVRLFEDACRQLLSVAIDQRQAWLAAQADISPQALALLAPVLERFQDQESPDLEPALAWCRRYAETIVA
jgi:hypothetical protein